jgi:hypothetical protein
MRVATFSRLGQLPTTLLLVGANVVVVVMTIVPAVLRSAYFEATYVTDNTGAISYVTPINAATYIFQAVAHGLMALFFIISGVLLQFRLHQADDIRNQPSTLQPRMLRFLLFDSAMMIGSAVVSGLFFRFDSVESFLTITFFYFVFLCATSSAQIFIFYHPRASRTRSKKTASTPSEQQPTSVNVNSNTDSTPAPMKTMDELQVEVLDQELISQMWSSQMACVTEKHKSIHK